MSLLQPLPAGLGRRFGVLFGGFALIGMGIALVIEAELGAAPWDVLHQGVARRSGLTIGTAGVLVGLVVFLAWIPLRLRPGVGTFLNAVILGPAVDLSMWALPAPHTLPLRWLALLGGTVLLGAGAGFYIGAGLGPGPRDGLMTGLAARGWPVRWVRTGLEVVALVAGWALGGVVGIGTVVVALGIGHVVAPALAAATRFTAETARAPDVGTRVASVEGAGR